jgi:hypothetical protein
MTESEAIRAAIAAWCEQSTELDALDARVVAVVEQAVERGFWRVVAMRETHESLRQLAHADPILREERAAILHALRDSSEQALAERLHLSSSSLAALRQMRPRAPRLTDEQRVMLGLAPRQLALDEPATLDESALNTPERLQTQAGVGRESDGAKKKRLQRA